MSNTGIGNDVSLHSGEEYGEVKVVGEMELLQIFGWEEAQIPGMEHGIVAVTCDFNCNTMCPKSCFSISILKNVQHNHACRYCELKKKLQKVKIRGLHFLKWWF